MTVSEREKWRANYRETSEALEAIEMRALEGMTDEEAMKIIKTLVAFEEPWKEPGEWSGLVEQQAIFHRRRNA